MNDYTRRIEAKRARGQPLLDLTISNPTEVLDDYPHEAIRNAYARIPDFAYRPNALGEEQARQSVSTYYEEYGLHISPEQIVLTSSSSESYSLLFKLFCDPGAEVLVPVPSYPLFEYLSALESVKSVPYRLNYDREWFVDFNHMRDRITSRTRAIVVVNPNNPTGSRLKKSECDDLFELASHYRLPVIADEVFIDYAHERLPVAKSIAGDKRGLNCSLNGLSKSAGMPQLKLGWIVLGGIQAEQEQIRERLELLLDTYLSVNTPVQRALPDLLAIGKSIRKKIAERVVRNVRSLDHLLEGRTAQAIKSEAGWSALVKLPATLPEAQWVARLLEEKNTVVQPGYFFDMPSEAYVIVSLITPPAVFDEGIQRLAALVTE